MFAPHLFIIFATISTTLSLCGSNIRWAHHFNMDDVYGIWYGVGYIQHTPDMTNKPNEVGCVTLYITDVSTEGQDDWLDWSISRRNYSDEKWRSSKRNPWSEIPISGSWMDVRFKRRAKRDLYSERRIRIMWDEDGQTMEQTYVYSVDAPGLWIADKRRVLEQEMMARGIDVWYPDDPPRHPAVIRVLNVSEYNMIINHCSEVGDGGIFSLILRRSPSHIERWEWYDLLRKFYTFEIPNIHRFMAICEGCGNVSSIWILILCITLLQNL